MDNYNYPLGADNSRAPWNERENDPIEVRVEVYEEVWRTVTITTRDYAVIDPEPQNGFPGEVDFDGIDQTDAYLQHHMRLTDTIDKALWLLERWKPERMSEDDAKAYKDILEDLDGWKDNELTIITED